jgi:transposase
MKKTISIEKRKEARRLRAEGWSIRKIARYLVCSTQSVVRWLNLDEAKIEEDGRGWRKGRMRKFGAAEEKRVVELFQELETEEAGLIEPESVRLKYQQRFGSDISGWFIQQAIEKYKKLKTVGQKKKIYDRCLEHVERRLRKLGEVIMNVAFWESRSANDPKNRACFLSCKYIYPYKFGIFSQVSGLTSSEVIRQLKSLLRSYVRPDIVKMSYHPTFGVNIAQQSCVGDLTLFLLNLGIKPFYSIPWDTQLYVDTGWFERIFLNVFSTKVQFGPGKEDEVDIENLYLEYRKKWDPVSRDVETKNPLFINAFTDEELKNRHVGRFLESNIFFLRMVKKKRKKIGHNWYLRGGDRIGCGINRFVGIL